MNERQLLEMNIRNDIRNLADGGWVNFTSEARLKLVSMCALRHVQAIDFGDVEIARRTEGNLRLALKELI